MVCQEMGHLGLLILSVKKVYFPWKHKETKDNVEDGTVPTGGTIDPFLCFPSSSQSPVQLRTRNLPILHGYCIAWMLGTCYPPDDPRKPLRGSHVGYRQNRATIPCGEGTLAWVRKKHTAPPKFTPCL